MKNTLFAGLTMIAALGTQNALAASACDLLPGANEQLDACSQGMQKLQSQVGALKARETELIGYLRQDQNAAKIACENDLSATEAQIQDLDRRAWHADRERSYLHEELRRLEQTTRDRGTWECLVFHLKNGYATIGTGRTQEEARLSATSKSDFKNNQVLTECTMMLQGLHHGDVGPRPFDPGQQPDDRNGPRPPRR